MEIVKEEKLSRGNIGHGSAVVVAENSNTKQFDGPISGGWKEHGLMSIHIQDGRWPSFIRDFLKREFTKRYGQRS